MAHVWIDVDNAPHVPFFMPIIGELESRGHEVFITVRDFGYTLDMIRRHDHRHDVIGVHPGRNKLKKILGLSRRVMALRRWVASKKIDVAVSHGSRALVLAARWARVPSLTLYDYEFVQTAIFNRFSTRVMLPEALAPTCIARMRIQDRAATYPGFKEDVYLGNFRPDPLFAQQLGIDDRVAVVLRPPATSAHYHNPESEAIMAELLRRVAADVRVLALVTPRSRAQARQIESLAIPNVRVLHAPVDGLNLLYHADLVVSGGGTMNREAALLGIPVYSIFMGRIGTLDQALKDQGKMTFIRSPQDTRHIAFTKKNTIDMRESDRRSRALAVTSRIVAEIESLAASGDNLKELIS